MAVQEEIEQKSFNLMIHRRQKGSGAG